MPQHLPVLLGALVVGSDLAGTLAGDDGGGCLGADSGQRTGNDSGGRSANDSGRCLDDDSGGGKVSKHLYGMPQHSPVLVSAVVVGSNLASALAGDSSDGCRSGDRGKGDDSGGNFGNDSKPTSPRGGRSRVVPTDWLRSH